MSYGKVFPDLQNFTNMAGAIQRASDSEPLANRIRSDQDSGNYAIIAQTANASHTHEKSKRISACQQKASASCGGLGQDSVSDIGESGGERFGFAVGFLLYYYFVFFVFAFKTLSKVKCKCPNGPRLNQKQQAEGGGGPKSRRRRRGSRGQEAPRSRARRAQRTSARSRLPHPRRLEDYYADEFEDFYCVEDYYAGELEDSGARQYGGLSRKCRNDIALSRNPATKKSRPQPLSESPPRFWQRRCIRYACSAGCTKISKIWMRFCL
jgi:hypothetical protein